MLSWFYGILMFLGGGFLIASLVLGEVAEFLDGLSDGFDGLLEGVGIDLVPDEVGVEGEEQRGIGCTTIAAFITGFGAAGLVSSFLGASPLGSVLYALLSGLVFGLFYASLMLFALKQQATTTIRLSDYVGKIGSVNINSDPGDVTQVTLEIRGQRKPYPALEEKGKKLNRGDLVEVIELKGGKLYVTKKE